VARASQGEGEGSARAGGCGGLGVLRGAPVGGRAGAVRVRVAPRGAGECALQPAAERGSGGGATPLPLRPAAAGPRWQVLSGVRHPAPARPGPHAPWHERGNPAAQQPARSERASAAERCTPSSRCGAAPQPHLVSTPLPPRLAAVMHAWPGAHEAPRRAPRAPCRVQRRPSTGSVSPSVAASAPACCTLRQQARRAHQRQHKAQRERDGACQVQALAGGAGDASSSSAEAASAVRRSSRSAPGSEERPTASSIRRSAASEQQGVARRQAHGSRTQRQRIEAARGASEVQLRRSSAAGGARRGAAPAWPVRAGPPPAPSRGSIGAMG
jgi:hypothetical protein